MNQENDFYLSEEHARAFCSMMLRSSRQYGVMFYDSARRITGWNAGAVFITGWTAGEVIGQSTAMLFVPEDRERRLDEHEATTASVVGIGEDERWHLRKDGSRFWGSGMSLPLKGDDGAVRGFVKVFRDATHLRARTKYLENELQANALQEAQRGRFLGTIAHEMRNPLSPIKSAIQLLEMPSAKPDTVQRVLPMMKRQLEALERLVEDLVDVTRLHTGKMSIAYETVILQQVLADGVEGCRPLASQQKVSLHVLAPPVPICVELDPQRFVQVISNLVNNSIKFAPGGNVWLTATVDESHLVIYLKDDGKGIAPELLPQIFDAFTQASHAGSERGAGIGLGLSVVKEIVALHQGTIEVRSEGLGKGTEFVVRLPLREPQGSEPEL